MSECKKAFITAFPKTVPILAGFLFLGISYGFFMMNKNFPVYYPIITSAVIFAGSMEFVLAGLLLAPFNPLAAFFLTIMINARHIFYGLAMLDKFKNTGWKKYILIFGLCDETFSINCNTKLPINIDKGWFMLHVTWLNYIYWVGGATIGAILGKYISFNTEGIDFVLTGLFLVIFVEQWLGQKDHIPASIGLFCSILSLIIFKEKYFIVPAMIMILSTFSLLRKKEMAHE